MKGHIRKRGTKWCIVVDIGTDPETGKRRQKWFSGYKTKKEAEKDVAKKITELHEGTFIQPSKVTVNTFLAEWIEAKKINVKKSTYDEYRGIIKNHLIPHLGEIKLEKLNGMHIQKFYNKLNETLSANTINLVHTILSTSLNQAVKFKLIPFNPAKMVESPRKEKTSFHVWDEDEVKHFIKASQKSRYHIAYLLAITTGMRMGEILGLRWQDVDLKNKTISINQTLSHDCKLILDTKTKQSKRLLPIDDGTTAALQKHKLRVKQEKLKAGQAYYNLDLVVCSQLGNLVFRSQFHVNFKTYIAKADLKVIRFHDLRHTHATLLLKQGVHPKVVSERLGHKDVLITLNKYSHILPGVQEQAVENFGKSIFG
ncbi:DNA integration/recombination/invertion protein [Bacillus thuringiensis serovar tolworthi]|uniref:DNA integration/recombination/invertion protein n=1 Tax=Bacillus thuringiensis subsp. tolworthi TaxID=1442 RepID=A0A9W3ZTW5_BACTO|nr:MULTISPECIES: site-specific integrase [Bacillus cereus group]MEB9591157.1 site-specific integrase [Bacillus cereus]MRC49447.1 tyrosine-type recombinase/integrase [Bacillus thuringiensis]BAR82929.1 DNA integration/recombination/invertion protein [Bacillus thuringiensis serovar tolworthi]